MILYFSTPLCTTLSSMVMLLVGQVVAHLRQTLQKSSTPMSMGLSATRGMLVRMGSPKWMRAPYFSVITIPFRPSSPMPAAKAVGMGWARFWTAS